MFRAYGEEEKGAPVPGRGKGVEALSAPRKYHRPCIHSTVDTGDWLCLLCRAVFGPGNSLNTGKFRVHPVQQSIESILRRFTHVSY